MSNKITLLSERPLTLNSMWLSDIIAPYLMLEYYDPNKTYDKKSTVFYAPYYYRDRQATPIQQQFLEDGFKIVYDNFWEVLVVDPLKYIMQHQDWFRYYESLWYQYLGHHTYQPMKNFTKLAFMPMRLARPHRDLAAKKLQPWLDDFVWSYVDKGRQLPNGGDAVNDWNTQRLFRPEWYNDTFFTFVSESTVNLNNQCVFVTEKTYKPIAFYHPFLIMGPKSILQVLKKQGFETFENLFDESYDTEPNWQNRLDSLVKNVSEYKKQPYDKLTQQKLQHNHALFFDHALSCRYIIEQIIEPLLNYAET